VRLVRICTGGTAFIAPNDWAQALRAREMPLFAEDPLSVPDFIGAGPDAPSDEAARRRFFAEDWGDEPTAAENRRIRVQDPDITARDHPGAHACDAD